MKAPRITPTGCPSCGAIGIPGTVCAGCVRIEHAAAERRVRLARLVVHTAHGPDCDAARMLHGEHDHVLAAQIGADLLLDFFGNEPALWRVGFEVPS